jgi:hypothetical protein
MFPSFVKGVRTTLRSVDTERKEKSSPHVDGRRATAVKEGNAGEKCKFSLAFTLLSREQPNPTMAWFEH